MERCLSLATMLFLMTAGVASDLAKDATERKNLAEANPEVVERLTKLHKTWAAEVEKGR